MKLLLLAVWLLGFTPIQTSASSVDKLLIKIDEGFRLIEAQKLDHLQKANDERISLISNGRDAELFKSILSTYGFLKENSSLEKDMFLQGALDAASQDYPKKIVSLRLWLQKEHSRVSMLHLKEPIYKKWNIEAKKILTAIDNLGQEHSFGTPALISSIHKSYHDLFSEVKAELQILKNTTQIIQPETSIKTVSYEPTKPSISTSHFSLFVAAILLSFLIGFSSPRKSKPIPKKIIEILPPPFVLQEENIEAEIPEFKEILYTDVEDECRSLIEENNHLLELSQIQIFPTPRSPFRTKVVAPTANVQEALNWLLKGTLAIVNNSGSKVSHLEWKCHENQGRVSVDFVLHGLECNSKLLYLNALIEGEGSAPANFGRSESALDGYCPTVVFRSGNQKTIISLGIDSEPTNISH